MDEKEIAGYRRLTFAGVAVSAVATMTSIVVVPLLFSYAQNVQSHLDVELRFCVMNTHNLFDEMKKVEEVTGQKSRIKRHGYRAAQYGYQVDIPLKVFRQKDSHKIKEYVQGKLLME
ncbi:nematode cuticle collagen domain protein, partial [Ostertagia ostertagi]